MKYQKIENWLEEIESFSTRLDRFHDEFKEIDNQQRQRILEWLQAAWECSRMEECPYCSNPEMGKVFFDQNCTGCVKRMEAEARKLKNGN